MGKYAPMLSWEQILVRKSVHFHFDERSGYSIGQGRGQRDVMCNVCVGSSPRRIRRSLRRKPLGEYGTKTDGCIRGATDFLQPISFQQEPSPSTRRTRFYTITSRRLNRAPR